MAASSDEVLACTAVGPSSAADANMATRPARQRERQRDVRITHGHYAKAVPPREVGGRRRAVRPMLLLFSSFPREAAAPASPGRTTGRGRCPDRGGQILATGVRNGPPR